MLNWGFFDWLFVSEIITNNPTEGIEHLKLSKKLPKVLSISEIEHAFEFKFTPLQSAILELLYAAGLRVSELSDMQLNNLNLKAKYVRCIGKGSKERIVPIGEKAVKALEKYLKYLYIVIAKKIAL